MMPLVNDAMPSTSSTTRLDRVMAAIATTTWSSPKPAVSTRDTRR
jgi:hypothetical protein